MNLGAGLVLGACFLVGPLSGRVLVSLSVCFLVECLCLFPR